MSAVIGVNERESPSDSGPRYFMDNTPFPIFTEKEWQTLRERLSLSPRQYELIRHLFDGSSDKEIASRMGISVSAVRAHIGRLFDKCRARDRVGLILCIVRCMNQIRL